MRSLSYYNTTVTWHFIFASWRWTDHSPVFVCLQFVRGWRSRIKMADSPPVTPRHTGSNAVEQHQTSLCVQTMTGFPSAPLAADSRVWSRRGSARWRANWGRCVRRQTCTMKRLRSPWRRWHASMATTGESSSLDKCRSWSSWNTQKDWPGTSRRYGNGRPGCRCNSRSFEPTSRNRWRTCIGQRWTLT